MHYRIFDLWRFAAALLVMVYHYLFFAPPELWERVGPFVQRPQGLLDLFFMISGFLVMTRHGETMREPRDVADFLRRRLAVLYPLHLLTLLFFVVPALAGAFGLMRFNAPEHWDLAQLPAHLLLLHALGTTPGLGFNFPSWSLSAEFVCYLLFPLLLLAHRRWGARALVLLLLGWVLFAEGAGAMGWLGPEHWSRANTFGAVRAPVGFLMGMLVALALRRGGRAPQSLWPAQGMLLLAFALMQGEAPPLVPLAVLALALYLAAAAETARPALTQGLERWMPLLRLSFGIYLWHTVAAGPFYQFLWNRHLADTGSLAFALFSLLPIGTSIALAALSAPFQRWAFRRITAGRGAERASVALAA